MVNKKNKPKLFVPGPVNVSEGLEYIGYFRDSNFTELVLENEKLLLKAIGCKKGRVIPYTCSGTGGMDAIVANLISKNDKVLVIDGGTFGRRWYEICKFYGKNVVRYSIEFGKDIDLENLTNMIDRIGATVVLTQHHETSSGQLYDIQNIGRITKKRGSLLIVDAISSFLTDPYDMDRFGADVTLISTQKGFRFDAGMAFVILNEVALTHSQKVKKLNYYSNFDKYLNDYNLGRGHVPFTPIVSVVHQLNKKLKKLDKEKEIKSVNKIALIFRKNIESLLDIIRFVPETPSNFLTSILIFDKRYNAKSLYDFLRHKDIFVTPTGKQLDKYLKNASNTYFRVGHIGCNLNEHKELIKELKEFFK